MPYDCCHMPSNFTPLHAELALLLPKDLHACCVTAVHPKGKDLFAAGRKPVNMFFVTRGEVVLERVGAHGGAAVMQRTRHGFVGEASLQSACYHCDGKVIAVSEITQISIALIRSALATDPGFAGRWIAMLNREVQRLRLQCERMSLIKVQDRLIHLLETQGVNGQYPLGSGLKSIASELGVTHEALYRCVAGMEKQGRLVRASGFLKMPHGQSA